VRLQRKICIIIIPNTTSMRGGVGKTILTVNRPVAAMGMVVYARDAWDIAARWCAAVAVDGCRDVGSGGGGVPRGSSIDWAPLFTPTTACNATTALSLYECLSGSPPHPDGPHTIPTYIIYLPARQLAHPTQPPSPPTSNARIKLHLLTAWQASQGTLLQVLGRESSVYSII